MAEGEKMMRILIVLVSILAACTFPPISGNKMEPAVATTSVIPVSPPVEITAPREEPVKPRKAAPKPATLDLKNPLADCLDVEHLDDPKEAARSRLDCMKDRLGGKLPRPDEAD